MNKLDLSSFASSVLGRWILLACLYSLISSLFVFDDLCFYR